MLNRQFVQLFSVYFLLEKITSQVILSKPYDIIFFCIKNGPKGCFYDCSANFVGWVFIQQSQIWQQNQTGQPFPALKPKKSFPVYLHSRKYFRVNENSTLQKSISLIFFGILYFLLFFFFSKRHLISECLKFSIKLTKKFDKFLPKHLKSG